MSILKFVFFNEAKIVVKFFKSFIFLFVCSLAIQAFSEPRADLYKAIKKETGVSPTDPVYKADSLKNGTHRVRCAC